MTIDANIRKIEGKMQDVTVKQSATVQKYIKSSFHPTKKMVRWFNTAQELGYGATLKAVSTQSRVAVASWYKWLQIDGFIEWFDELHQKQLKLIRWKLDQIGLKKAETNYEYWRDMMIRTGNLIPTGITQQFNQFNIPESELKRITG